MQGLKHTTKSTSSHKPHVMMAKHKSIKKTSRFTPLRKASTQRKKPNPTKSSNPDGRTSYLSDQRFAGYKLERHTINSEDEHTNVNDYDSLEPTSQNPLATPLPFTTSQLEALQKNRLIKSEKHAIQAQFQPLVPQSTYQWTHLAHTMSKLDNYSVIELSGPDSTKVLHSLTTQDITNYALNSYPTLVESTSISQQHHPSHLNTTSTTAAFLTAKGRMNYTAVISLAQTPVLSDLSILPTPDQQVQVIKKTNQLELAMKINAGYHIIVPKSVSEDLVKHIKENSLRLKSKLNIRHDLLIYSVISSLDPSLISNDTNNDVNTQFMSNPDRIIPPFDLNLEANPIFTAHNSSLPTHPSDNNAGPITIVTDPRPLPKHLSHHYIIAPLTIPLHSTLLQPRKNAQLSLPVVENNSESEEHGRSTSSSAPLYTFTNEIVHDVFSTLYNLPNNSNGIQPGKSLPLEYNIDLGNGVSYNKGCYLGQELTSRTHHRGEIRKRAVPAFFVPLDVSSPSQLKESLQYAYMAYRKMGFQMLKEMALLDQHFDDCDIDESLAKYDHTPNKDVHDNESGDENDSNNSSSAQQAQTASIEKRIFNYGFFNGSSLESMATEEMPETSIGVTGSNVANNRTSLESKLPPKDSPIYHTIKMLLDQQALLNNIQNPSQEEIDPREYVPQQGDGVRLYDLSQHFTQPKDGQHVDHMTLVAEQSKIALKDDVGTILFSPNISNVGTIQFRTDFFTKPFTVGQISIPPTFVITRKKQKILQTQDLSSQPGTESLQTSTVEELAPVNTYSGQVWQCFPICPDYVSQEVFSKMEEEIKNVPATKNV